MARFPPTVVFLLVLVAAGTAAAESFSVDVAAGAVEFTDVSAGAGSLSFSLEAGSTPVSLYMLDSVSLASYNSFGSLNTGAFLSCVDATSCDKTVFLGQSVAIVAFAVSNDGESAVTVTVNVEAYEEIETLDQSFTETIFQQPGAFEIYSIYYGCTMDYTISSLDGSTAAVAALDAEAYMDWLQGGASGLPTAYEPDSCSTSSTCSKQLKVTATSTPLLVYIFVSNESTESPAQLSFDLHVTECALSVTQSVGGGDDSGNDNGNDNDNDNSSDDNPVHYWYSGDTYDSSGFNLGIDVMPIIFWLIKMAVFIGCCCCVCCILPGSTVVLLLRTRKAGAPAPAEYALEPSPDFTTNGDSSDVDYI